MTPDDLLRRVCETSFAYQALGNQRWQAHGAGFVLNPATPRRHDANMVGLVRTTGATQIEALFTEIEQVYRGFNHRLIATDALTPREFETRLAMEDGYRQESNMVHLLEGELDASPPPADLREVLSDADWELFLGLDELWWRESGESETAFGPYDRDLHLEMLASKRAKHPMIRTWFALAEGAPAGFFSSWPGENGVGMVEDLFVHPWYRRRGLATALLAHCVADARARGAGPVLITSSIADTPKHMYAAMGFRPLYVQRAWTKRLA